MRTINRMDIGLLNAVDILILSVTSLNKVMKNGWPFSALKTRRKRMLNFNIEANWQLKWLYKLGGSHFNSIKTSFPNADLVTNTKKHDE